MAKFAYTALAADGSTVSGVLAASTSAAAYNSLLQRNLQPLELSEKKSILQFEITPRTVNRTELMHFSRQLSVFITAGVSRSSTPSRSSPRRPPTSCSRRR